MARYTYSVAVDLHGVYSLDRLMKEVHDTSAITVVLAAVDVAGDDLTFTFRADLPDADKAALDAVVVAHTGTPLPATALPVTIDGPKDERGTLRTVHEKSTDPKANIFSINLCDRTTWFWDAERVPGEVVAGNQLARFPVVDVSHGKVTGERALRATHGVVVRDGGGAVLAERSFHHKNLVAMGKKPPEWEPAWDYELDYKTGVLTWRVARPDVVVADYSASRTSLTVASPKTERDLQIIDVEVNFSDDVEMLDAVVFQAFAGPPGGKVPVDEAIVYETAWDLVAESNGAYPEIQPICSPENARGMRGKKARILRWAYATGTELPAAVGAELRLQLEHDEAYEGTYATVTFYGVLK